MQNVKLSNGVEIPILGFGVYLIPKEDTKQAVLDALDAGYRHIDTAQLYLNEKEVGDAIKESPIDRKDIFVKTKIWIQNTSYDGVKKSFQESLDRLQMDYVDLLLIHQPYNDSYGAWRAMEELLADKKVRAIGVSNFEIDKALDLGLFNDVMPMVDQIEINPFDQKTKQVEQLQAENIQVEAWSPFARGKNGIFTNEVLSKIGLKYGKTPAQVISRWLVQRNIVVLAKSVHKERIAQNLDIFDFELTDAEMAEIKKIDLGQSQFMDHADPDTVKAMAKRRSDEI